MIIRSETTSKLLAYLQPALLLSFVFSLIIGFKFTSTDNSLHWSGEGLRGFGWLLLVFCVVAGGLAFSPLKTSGKKILISLVASGLIGGIGIFTVLSAAYVVLACYTLGAGFLHVFKHELDRFDVIWKILIGLLFYSALFGLMLHFPINTRLLYFLLLLFPIIYYLLKVERISKISSRFSHSMNANLESITGSIGYAELTFFLLITFYSLSGLFLPSVMADDHSYHLAMWSQLKVFHEFNFSPAIQIWYLAPFLVDLFHSVVSIVAGQDGRGGLNFFLVLMILSLVWRASGFLLSNPLYRFRALLLFITTPMTANVLLGLQTELFLAVLFLVGIILIQIGGSLFDKWVALCVVSGLLLAIKFTALILVVALSISFFWTVFQRKKEEPLRQLRSEGWLLSVIAVIVGLHSYVNAYWISGNPVFPLYNGIFKSTFTSPSNFSDPTWIKGFSLESYWGYFFNSSNYFESYNYIAGFQFLFLPVFGALYLLINKRHFFVPFFLLPTFYCLVMFSQTQYLRYMYPALPLLSIVSFYFFVPVVKDQYKHFAHVFGQIGCYLIIVLNFIALPGVSWIYASRSTILNYTAQGKVETQDIFIPDAKLYSYINENDPGSKVFIDLTRPYAASLMGTPYYYSWISSSVMRVVDNLKSEEEMAQFFDKEEIKYVVWHDYFPPESKRLPYKYMLESLLVSRGVEVMRNKDVVLFRLNQAIDKK